MKIKIQHIVGLLFIAVIVQLAACGASGEAGSYVTENYPTSEITLSLSISVLADNTSDVHVELFGSNSRTLRLSPEDKLYLELDGVRTELSEVYLPSNLQLPEPFYYYEIQLIENIALRTVNVILDRVNYNNAVTPILFGDAPDIISPLANSVFTRASDDVVVNWRPSSVPVDQLAVGESPCGRNMYFYDQDAAISSVTFPAATNVPLLCQNQGVSILVTNVWRPTPAPELSPQSFIYARIHRSVGVVYDPQ